MPTPITRAAASSKGFGFSSRSGVAGTGGSNGTDATTNGGTYGGGATKGGTPGSAAVLIIWPGATRQYPFNNTALP